MTGHPTRRTVLAGAAVAAGTLAAPAIVKAQQAPIRIGVLHPVTGALAQSGTLCRAGALLAIEHINAAGGIKSLGGARLEPVLADAQSRPEAGVAEIDKLNEAGVVAVQGPFASGIALATTQAAARHNLAHLVDVGVVDTIVSRGLTNTFRFGPGFGAITRMALDNLVRLNDGAGKIARTVMVIHEDSAFGAGMAKLMNDELPKRGFEVVETISHPTPQRDFTNIALRARQARPDLIIPSNYFNEFVLMARTFQQQRVSVKGIYAVLGGAASNIRFVREHAEAAENIMDCNHWYDPRKAQSQAFAAGLATKNVDLTYETMLNYACMQVLADALERAASRDRGKVIEALASSTFADHIMPYGPTKFENGQNTGAQPVNTQVIKGRIEVIFPQAFASAEPVFPMPPRG
ncbi:MAG: ABC transporter substrate-binding protein [Alphaproteobacteria bacterium]|nr:ABC transporter substrate-binding protein [Alphaproteobacteria bacterium]TAD87988.1 MAG: ABC transporter substrate-binding protein [Alphaproteobacteria bacterium]